MAKEVTAELKAKGCDRSGKNCNCTAETGVTKVAETVQLNRVEIAVSVNVMISTRGLGESETKKWEAEN